MSFLDGPDCGPVNPLQSLLKHSERDAGAGQHDRWVQTQQGASSSASMRTMNGGSNPAAQDAEFSRFMATQNGPGQVPGDAFAMDAMSREIAAFHQHQHQQQRNGSNSGSGTLTPSNPEWARQFANGSPAQQAESWRQAYLNSPAGASSQQQQQAPSTTMQQQPSMPMYQNTMNPMAHFQPAFGGGMMGNYMQYAPSNIHYQAQQAPAVTKASSKGKERFVELDDKAWEAEFAKLAESSKTATQDASAQMPEPFQDTIQEDQEAVREADEETDADFAKRLEKTWRNLRDTLDTSSLDDQELATWEAQYGTNFADLHGGEYDYEQNASEYPAGYDPAKFDEWLREATQKPYPFAEEQDNPFLDSFDPFAEGQRLLREGHPLSEAALAFEAACKQNEHRGEAWRALGDTLAADEKELKAIKALERAVSCPDGGGEGAWMSLAISYVNEGQDMRAFATLEKWITTAYPGVAKETLNEASSQPSPWAISERIIQMFVAAAIAGPGARQATSSTNAKASVVDADVQSGLGVLFYTNSDYARAKDCFEAALSVRPDDFLLWNRLGATLANGGQPEDAIEAYRKALELRPTFTRAIYNLGVSCLNINCFHESAEHLLAALDLHRKDQLIGSKRDPDLAIEGDDGSENLWHTLRRAFFCMDRADLAERAQPGADVESFRKDGFDF